ncbi:hypothetical protein [Stenotrophobium rhamnosiphilum]|uniref:Uncharacterized protein n=1 Tax=Stenotrophobium rhamnosiphilum TaxID=2029166 RepID=A0A2T5MEH4_9GAMM|nr:hypothetical protein [Stenotrophobium rhamnosiphilum]PTU30973.1 hypothetical protein CJD38_11755 [Stenotrophobium rhamnosiphilum]
MSQATSLTAADLKKFSVEQSLELFLQLEAPAMSEMNGEYPATLLQQPSLLATLAGQVSVRNPLVPWLCKAFRPVDVENGRGYNTFRTMGRIVQRFPMQTVIAPSRYDGKPAYQLVYRAYNSMCGDIHMVDEVRRVSSNLYLGIGTWGFTNRQRQVALPFMLEGPTAPYRGDIGTPRKGFALSKEVPALRN